VAGVFRAARPQMAGKVRARGGGGSGAVLTGCGAVLTLVGVSACVIAPVGSDAISVSVAGVRQWPAASQLTGAHVMLQCAAGI